MESYSICLLWLAYFTQPNVLQVHQCWSMWQISSFLKLNNQLHVYTMFYLFVHHWWTFVVFQHLIMNSAATNVGIQISFQDLPWIILYLYPAGGLLDHIAVLFFFFFFYNLHNVFPSSCIILHLFPPIEHKYLNFSISSLGLISFIFNSSHPNGWEVVSHNCVALYFSDD